MNLAPNYPFSNNSLSEQLMLIGKLFDGQKIGMLVIDEYGRIVDCNSFCETIFQSNRQDLIRETFSDLFPPVYREIANQNHIFFFKTPNNNEFIADIVNSKGLCIPVIISSEISSDYKGHLLRIAAIKIQDKKTTFEFDEGEKTFSELEKKVLLFEKIIDHTTEGIMITNAPKNGINPEIVFANKAMSKMTGYSASEIIGKQVNVFYGPETDFEELILISDCIKKEKSGEFEIINYRKDGTKFYNRYKIMPVFNAAGKCINWVSTAEDITKKRKQKELLLESENKFRNLVENSPVGIYIMTKAGFVFVNEKLANTVGYTQDEIYKLKTSEFIHADDIDVLEDRLMKRLLGYNLDENFETRILTKAGEILNIETHGARTIYQGEAAVIGSAIDITEKIKNASKIRKYSQAIEQSGASIVITNLDGEIEYVNPAFCITTGYSQEETIGRNPRFLKSNYTEPESLKDLWHQLSNNKSWTGIFINMKKNGDLYWEHAIISPILNEKGEKTNYVAVKEDITKRILLEEEKEKLINEISIKYNELKQFSFILTHNLRAPLTNLMGIIDLADTSEIFDETSKNLIEGFKKSTKTLNDTLDDLINTYLIKENETERAGHERGN